MTAPSNDTVARPDQAEFLTDKFEDLEAFDELPSPIRKALSEHVHPLAAKPILDAWLDPAFRQDLDCVERMEFVLHQIRSFRS